MIDPHAIFVMNWRKIKKMKRKKFLVEYGDYTYFIARKNNSKNFRVILDSDVSDCYVILCSSDKMPKISTVSFRDKDFITAMNHFVLSVGGHISNTKYFLMFDSETEYLKWKIKH